MATYTGKGSICSYYTMSLIVSESNVNNAANESTVNYELKLTSSGGYWFELIGSTVKITIDGEEVFNEYSKKDITANGTIPIKKGSKVVKHNANGSKTVNCKAEWTQSSTANYTPGKMTASGDLPLTDIPRASKITCADFNIGSSATVVVTKATNEFLHTVTYNISGITGIIGDEYASTPTLGWNTEDIANDIYAKIPTETSIKGTLYCKTYNSSKVQVGETTETTFTAFVVNSNPTISIDSVIDTLAGSIAVTGNSQKLVNGISNAQATVTAKSKNGAKIKNIKILTSDGRIFSSDRNTTETSVTLANVFSAVKNNSDSFTFEAQVTDTRNLTNIEKVTLSKSAANGTWVNYILPVITGINAERANSTSSSVTLKVTANKWNGNFGSVTNGTVLQWKYKLATSDTWLNEYQNITPTVNGNTLSYTGVLPVAFEYNKDYIIQVRIADSLSEDDLTAELLRGEPVIDIGESDVAVNGDISAMIAKLSNLLLGEYGFDLNSAFGAFATQNGDANTYTRTGIYYLGSSSTNVPASWIRLFVMGRNDNNDEYGDLVQIAVNVNIEPKMWIRCRNGATWYDWKLIAQQSHPVGAIVVTSTNKNPSNEFGGTWELIDKEFTPTDIGDVMTMNSTNTSESKAWGKRGGHSISFNGTFTNKVTFNDTERELGTLNLANMGVTRLPDAFRFVGFTDGGNSEIFLYLLNTGVLKTVDIGGNLTSVAADKTWFWSITMVWHNIEYMLDSACNKFYWKRTA